MDGPFILNEVMHWCKVKHKQALIFKVDFEKAYDSVRWDYLDEGLKQGDPLSPFLFILVMESLHLSFQRVVDGGLFTGLNLNSSVTISHMFYADDAVFIGQWKDGNINTLVHVLECFYQASGLRLNLCKSQILGLNVAIWGRIPESQRNGRCRVKVAAYQGECPKWKMKFVYQLVVNRFTLIKSVLGSIPIFHMSIYKVPMQVLRRLESIRNQFFNGNDPGNCVQEACKTTCSTKLRKHFVNLFGIDIILSNVLGSSILDAQRSGEKGQREAY
ncbi:RNA-directed DNA polymerase, eukaryota, reverse transcriptase zinc-binding domain protein [Tanacetum coccineum]